MLIDVLPPLSYIHTSEVGCATVQRFPAWIDLPCLLINLSLSMADIVLSETSKSSAEQGGYPGVAFDYLFLITITRLISGGVTKITRSCNRDPPSL